MSPHPWVTSGNAHGALWDKGERLHLRLHLWKPHVCFSKTSKTPQVYLPLGIGPRPALGTQGPEAWLRGTGITW